VVRGPVAVILAFVGCDRADDPCEVGIPATSIHSVLEGIETLPSPVTLDCVLASLERPVGIELTSDVFNTQPAHGPESPRMMLRSDTLTLTVVPVGEASNLLEFGEVHSSGLTLKAELAFPLDLPLGPEAAFERLLDTPDATSTGCQVCHFTEEQVEPGRFASNALRPPDGMTVPLEVLRDEHASCDWNEDALRCSLFAAVLDHGDVFHAPFDDEVMTQFGPP
jgi:hypothetical protein